MIQEEEPQEESQQEDLIQEDKPQEEATQPDHAEDPGNKDTMEDTTEIEGVKIPERDIQRLRAVQ